MQSFALTSFPNRDTVVLARSTALNRSYLNSNLRRNRLSSSHRQFDRQTNHVFTTQARHLPSRPWRDRLRPPKPLPFHLEEVLPMGRASFCESRRSTKYTDRRCWLWHRVGLPLLRSAQNRLNCLLTIRNPSIWLLEAAEDYPNAEALDGLDIALHQAPPEHFLPDNVRFKYLDLQEELPSEFVGRYDLVHARFLLGLVKNNDPVPILKNLLKLLST